MWAQHFPIESRTSSEVELMETESVRRHRSLAARSRTSSEVELMETFNIRNRSDIKLSESRTSSEVELMETSHSRHVVS